LTIDWFENWYGLRHIEKTPADLYRLAQAVTGIDPGRLRGCVLDGRAGFAGAASVVFPDVRQARRLGADARRDGTLDGGCHRGR